MDGTITQLYWAQTYGMDFFFHLHFLLFKQPAQKKERQQQKHLSGVVLREIYDDDVFFSYYFFLLHVSALGTFGKNNKLKRTK